MPCGDGGGWGSTREVRVENPTAKKGLCAILTVLEERDMLEDVLSKVDWTEAGISREKVLKWWANHKRQDRQRRLEERRERKRKQLEKAALEKLSPEERKVLGLQYKYDDLLGPTL